jgi:uncharacterized protein YbjT (DUF2867 family)
MTATHRILVTAASGRIGSRVARGLLDAGHRVRIVARNGDHLTSLVDRGAEPAIGDLRDREFASRAFQGIDTAFLVVRADRSARDYRRDFGDVGRTMAAALATQRVRKAVFVSALGAHHDKHRGLILIHRDVELALGAVAELELTCLRAPFFFENLLYFETAMRERSGLYTPIDPDVAIDVVSTAEVASAALRLLDEPAPTGRVRELRSQPVTMRQIGGEIAAQLRRPFAVERTQRDADIAAMVAAGATYDFAHLMNDAWDTFSREGRLGDPAAPSTETSTSIAELVRTIVIPRLM